MAIEKSAQRDRTYHGKCVNGARNEVDRLMNLSYGCFLRWHVVVGLNVSGCFEDTGHTIRRQEARMIVVSDQASDAVAFNQLALEDAIPALLFRCPEMLNNTIDGASGYGGKGLIDGGHPW